MGTTRIKVIDLSAETEQVKTSRKRAIKGLASAKVKKPQVKEKREKKEGQILEEVAAKPEIGGKIEPTKEPQAEEILPKKKAKVTHIRGKKYQNAKSLVDPTKLYPLDEAIELVKKTNYAAFDGSIEAHIICKTALRGNVTLPHGTGKKQKTLVFQSKTDGLVRDGIILGNEKTIEEIEQGKLSPKKDFNLVIATGEFMPQLAKVAKILGPAGLMPNPKSGTVTDDPAKFLQKVVAGQIEYKTESLAPVVHTVIGKVSLKNDQLKENFASLISSIGAQRIKKITLSATMSLGVKVDLSTINTKF